MVHKLQSRFYPADVYNRVLRIIQFNCKLLKEVCEFFAVLYYDVWSIINVLIYSNVHYFEFISSQITFLIKIGHFGELFEKLPVFYVVSLLQNHHIYIFMYPGILH